MSSLTDDEVLGLTDKDDITEPITEPIPGLADILPDSFINIEHSIRELPGQADRKRALLWLGDIKKLVLPNL